MLNVSTTFDNKAAQVIRQSCSGIAQFCDTGWMALLVYLALSDTRRVLQSAHPFRLSAGNAEPYFFEQIQSRCEHLFYKLNSFLIPPQYLPLNGDASTTPLSLT